MAGIIDFQDSQLYDMLGKMTNPPWHAASGAKSWLFLDEIIVN